MIITLADGTEIPVVYGEKEGFGFEIGGGRKGFCVLEDLESLRSMQLTVPYTITGEAEKLEDVSVVVLNMQSLGDTWHSKYSTPVMQWEVEETSPGSGNIILSLDRLNYDEELYYGFGYNASYGSAPYEEVEATSTSFPLWVRLRLMNRNFYDGPALTPFTFSDIFSESHNGNMSATVEYAEPIAYSWHNGTEIGLEYPVTYKYAANTTGKERKTNIALYRKISSNIGTGFFFLYLIQAAH